MEFRRSGPLDERRRRVLMDEIASPTDNSADPSASTAAKGPVRAYCAAVLSERQPRVTDLLPVRPLWAVCCFLLGLTGIATIETVHIYASTTAVADGASLLAPLDATGRGSLTAWYSSALLALAAGLSLLIFGIRAHRIDDYRGRYRVWLWTTAALAWLSLDAATGIHDAVALGITLLAGKQVMTASVGAACTMTWLAIYALLFGTLAIRLMIEVWPSLVSFSSLMLAMLVYLCCGMLKLDMISPSSPLIASVVESSLTMIAHLSLVTAIGIYARHVYLDATGRLKVHIDADKRKVKSKVRAKLKVVKSEKSTTSTEAVSAGTTKQSVANSGAGETPAFGATRSAGKPGAAITTATVSNSSYDDEDEDDEQYGDEKLSKSERRRLKKLARREQQRRAA
jgi:hypothetical protein